MSYGNYVDFSQIKKVLVIKLRHHGDVLLSSPVFTVLKKRYPHLDIHALLYQDTLPMLEGLSAISSFHVYDKAWKQKGALKKLWQEGKLYRRLSKEDYDLVINLTEGDRGALVSLFSGAKFKIGVDPKDRGLLAKRHIYTHLIKKAPGFRHSVEKDLDALRCLGIFPELEEKALSLVIPEEASKKVDVLLSQEGMTPGHYILLHPVSRWRFKCPPIRWFQQLIQALEKKGLKVVLSASPDPIEMGMVEEILKEVNSKSAISLAGKTSLKELGALIQKSHTLITVDSVPLHIASALKTPVIALFGPSSELNWGPWQHPQAHVVTDAVPCRPCFMDGCGGSKFSDCLSRLPIPHIISLLEA